MTRYLYYICFIIIYVNFFVQINSEKHVALFTFGDSLFGTQHNSSKPCPNGKTFKHPTQRCPDGCKIPDFIAQYAGLPYIPPYGQSGNFVGGSNFAFNGALALRHLKIQLERFQNVSKLLKHALGEAEAAKIISNAVYMFSIGTNDYTHPTVYPNVSRENLLSMVIGNITYIVKGIYEEGGRKFAFISLCPIGCIPNRRLQSGDCHPDFNKLARKHNKAVSKVLENMWNNLSGFEYSVFDFYKTGKQRIDHPLKYGFKEGRRNCCEAKDDPCAFVFIDNHPSEKADEQFAHLAWNGTLDVVSPYNFKTLFDL